jgi:hypothetical protein
LGATEKYKTRLRKANILLEVLVHGLEGDTGKKSHMVRALVKPQMAKMR